MKKMKHCIVIGNGPSSKELLLLEQKNSINNNNLISAYTIGCNRVYSGVAAAVAMALDVLLAADVWCQFDIVRDEYPRKNRCKFIRWNPIPIEVYSEQFVQSMCPGYKVIEHNPEQRKYADSWMFYATSKEDFENAEGAINYWKPNCGYLCWIPAGYQIDNSVNFIDKSCPTGAYALKEALNGNFDKVDVYGFDSIAGVYSSTTQDYYDSHEKEKMGLDFIKWYDIIMKESPGTTEVNWHTL